ncbi:MAG: hypothetical protein LBU64_02395 [Planctomycetota bacterium]|jgi:DNA-binding MurR/RpiR family transcriptional regulator|nr:hypothetical protein [Planctomycetota bacterium]
MTSVLGRPRNFDKVPTPSEVKVAEFIRRRPGEVVDNSIKAAALAGVSIASASRLAATLGYRDWKEMRHASRRRAAASRGFDGSASGGHFRLGPALAGRRGDPERWMATGLRR